MRNLVSGRGGTGKKVAAAASGAVVVHGVMVAAEGAVAEGGIRVSERGRG